MAWGHADVNQTTIFFVWNQLKLIIAIFEDKT